MSTDASTQTGPTLSNAADTRADVGASRQSPQALIQESIKYRRRAQDAERRAEALEAELADLRGDRDCQNADLQALADQARAEAESLRARLSELERDRALERELTRAGAVDTETALALARQRLAGAETPDDLAAFAKALVDEKPHLATAPARQPANRPTALPARTAGAKPAQDAPGRAADRLADRARQSGRASDVLAYMRARRGVVA